MKDKLLQPLSYPPYCSDKQNTNLNIEFAHPYEGNKIPDNVRYKIITTYFT